MDSFESLIANILEYEGYWVYPSFKVELTSTEKKKIGKPTCPRWEIDLLAYKGRYNELLVVECKSFLDSTGVRYRGFNGTDKKDAKRYKLFNDLNLRRTILKRVVKQLVESGSCSKNPKIKLCLATGKMASEDDRKNISKLFNKKGWKLFDDLWIKNKLKTFAELKYENRVSAVVAKLLQRG